MAPGKKHSPTLFFRNCDKWLLVMHTRDQTIYYELVIKIKPFIESYYSYKKMLLFRLIQLWELGSFWLEVWVISEIFYFF